MAKSKAKLREVKDMESRDGLTTKHVLTKKGEKVYVGKAKGESKGKQ